MPHPIKRDGIIDDLREMPAAGAAEEASARMAFVMRIEQGLKDLDAGRVVEHHEVKRRLGL